jgi:hypothetical protein
VLAKADLPLGEKFHSTGASYYLLAEGKDHYRAVFAWAELDPSFMDKAIYVATKKDGKPLPEGAGPLELVVPGEKRNARWVRQVEFLRVMQEPATAAYGTEQACSLEASLSEIRSIQIGSTRADLLKLFTEDGGISERWRRRFVYRKCLMVKVDVDFAPQNNPNDFVERPDDRIVKISKPYLERMSLD